MHPEVITSLYEEAKKRAEWLEDGLKLIATASNQHNPIYLRKIAKSYLSNQYNTIQEEHEHRPLPAQFGGDTGIDADY
jgi:glutathionylspermidine synthase